MPKKTTPNLRAIARAERERAKLLLARSRELKEISNKIVSDESLKVVCPVCDAAIGKPCELNRGGARNSPHRERRIIAKEKAPKSCS